MAQLTTIMAQFNHYYGAARHITRPLSETTAVKKPPLSETVEITGLVANDSGRLMKQWAQVDGQPD